jgi:hypothetical protein
MSCRSDNVRAVQFWHRMPLIVAAHIWGRNDNEHDDLCDKRRAIRTI